MKKQAILYFVFSMAIIFVSSPLGYYLLNFIFKNRNLAGEYVLLLNGFIHSLMLIGTLIFSLGIVTMIKDKK